MNRQASLPGIGTFHGYSGYGKTFSATFGAHKHKAAYVEVGDSWTKKKFCENVLRELGGAVSGTIADMVERIIELLVDRDQPAPLIIDEADYIIERGLAGLVREIHDKSGAPIILIGEELLPNKLEKIERFHNRILSWVPAEPSSMGDLKHLARMYCPGVQISPALAQQIYDNSDGRARRICVQLVAVHEAAKRKGLSEIDLTDMADQQLYTGRAPIRRG